VEHATARFRFGGRAYTPRPGSSESIGRRDQFDEHSRNKQVERFQELLLLKPHHRRAGKLLLVGLA
jgi:hypothetical protein